ncbi:MAG: PKD domain-containing protein, partial [Thermoplasmata archaeon]|nr:PKD domain-containing protein [Thermoplasmata archaeon]
MSVQKEDATRTHRWRSRALSTATAAIVMVVVVVVVGAAAYYAVGGGAKNTSTTGSTSTCQPANSFVCQHSVAQRQVHDLNVLAPFKAAQTQTPVPFTAQVPNGEVGTSYTFSFGDGTNVTSTQPTVSHTYSTAGTYLILLQASIAQQTTVHDNYLSLVALTVTSGYSASSAGSNPNVAGSIVSNSTSTTSPTSVLLAGQQVTLSGVYTGAPTNPLFTLGTPSIAQTSGSTTGVTSSGLTVNAQGATATFAFANAGTYVVTFVGLSNGVGSFAGQKAYQNYSWSVIVTPPALHAKIAGTASATSPHPGTFINYFSAPGGASTLDPSIAYDTVSYEPILNTYEGLIMYNGSTTGPDPSSYVPVLATCVPGSASCQQLYGKSLVNLSASAYTFVIDSKAQFFDPYSSSNGAHWGVYPTDVVFSVLRTEGYSTQP